MKYQNKLFSASCGQGREQIQNKPGRCASAVHQDAGSCTGLGLFANATHKEEPDQYRKQAYW